MKRLYRISVVALIAGISVGSMFADWFRHVENAVSIQNVDHATTAWDSYCEALLDRDKKESKAIAEMIQFERAVQRLDEAEDIVRTRLILKESERKKLERYRRGLRCDDSRLENS